MDSSDIRRHQQSGRSGLMRTRLLVTPMSRRAFSLGMLATGAAAASGLIPSRAAAAVNVNYMGWQGYDTGIDVDDFYKKNDIALQTTYMAGNEEIIAAITGVPNELSRATRERGPLRPPTALTVVNASLPLPGPWHLREHAEPGHTLRDHPQTPAGKVKDQPRSLFHWRWGRQTRKSS